MELNKDQVKQAVAALKQFFQKQGETNVELLNDESTIILQFGLIKIPACKNKIIKVQLPHSLMTETTDVCLFVKDFDKNDSDESKDHYLDLLQKHKVTSVSEVIPLKTLKTEYKPFEAKRNLSNMYEEYLADERIVRLLPDFLGKHFYRRKRYPKQVNMKATDLKREITQALSLTQCIISGRGSTSQVKVGTHFLNDGQIVENIYAAVDKLQKALPGGGQNIKHMQLKTPKSPALRIYWSDESPDSVSLPKVAKKFMLDEPEDVTPVMNGKVRVTRYGSVQIINERTKKNYDRKGNLKEGAKKRLKALALAKSKTNTRKRRIKTSDNQDNDSTPLKQSKNSKKTSSVIHIESEALVSEATLKRKTAKSKDKKIKENQTASDLKKKKK